MFLYRPNPFFTRSIIGGGQVSVWPHTGHWRTSGDLEPIFNQSGPWLAPLLSAQCWQMQRSRWQQHNVPSGQWSHGSQGAPGTSGAGRGMVTLVIRNTGGGEAMSSHDWLIFSVTQYRISFNITDALYYRVCKAVHWGHHKTSLFEEVSVPSHLSIIWWSKIMYCPFLLVLWRILSNEILVVSRFICFCVVGAQAVGSLSKWRAE